MSVRQTPPAKTAKLLLTLEVEYALNGTPVHELLGVLKDVGTQAHAGGDLIAATTARVRDFTVTVECLGTFPSSAPCTEGVSVSAIPDAPSLRTASSPGHL